MRQGTKRLLSMAISLVAIVLAFVTYIEGIRPAYGDLQEVRGKLSFRQEFEKNQRDAVSKVQSLIADYSGETSILQKDISAALPLGPDLSSALVQIVGLIDLSELKIVTIKPTLSPPPIERNTGLVRPLGRITFDLAVNGTFPQIKNFLRKLEVNNMIFDVQNISLKAVKPGTDNLNISLKVVSYFQQL